MPGLVEWDTFNTAPMCSEENCEAEYGGRPYCPATDAECTKLRTGLYNFVIMIHDKVPLERTELYPNRLYKSKVPIDFMAYLYDGPMYYCKSDCRPDPTADIAGKPTFASIKGTYGSGDASKCSVCGLGPGSATATSNCTANPNPNTTCYGLAADGLSIVPPTNVCVLNRPPYFYQQAEKFGVNNNPDTPQVNNSHPRASHSESLLGREGPKEPFFRCESGSSTLNLIWSCGLFEGKEPFHLHQLHSLSHMVMWAVLNLTEPLARATALPPTLTRLIRQLLPG